jgi:MFS family permease
MNRFRNFFGLERNILVMLAVIVAVGMGEELWSRFIPKYLELLGAGTWGIAAYGTLKDILDAVYQYPGGWLADRLGRRKALMLFTLLAMIGYVIYLLGSDWIWVLAGTVFVMAWSSLSSPAVFAIIGDTLPQQRRSIGFGVQSVLKRVPIVIAPSIGGLLVASFGFFYGIKIGLIATLVLAVVAIAIVHRLYVEQAPSAHDRSSFKSIWCEMDPHLKRLLAADCLARWAEGIPKVFIVLYVIDILHMSPVQFGWLTSIQMIASILVYIPIAKLSDRLNRKPFILLTFAFFALFPLGVVGGVNLEWLVIAFILGGLREIGEPARKALIVDLAKASSRGRAVGAYYLVRGLVVFPASILGGWLWLKNPQLPFYTAFAIGVVGCILYGLVGTDKKTITV